MSWANRARLGIAFLILARAVVAGLTPLSADEAYYWLWSRHLAWGYFDHPPAIAFLIRIGTGLFGNGAFGVRAMGVPAGLLATYLVFETARTLFKDGPRTLLAVLLFNLTLMANVELSAATPDMPSIVTSAAFLLALVKLDDSGDGRWWLAAGLAAGLGLLSKYAVLFLGVGAVLWLLASPRGRRWLATLWPWAGGGVALLVFMPGLIWQAHHHWETLVFQLARITQGHLTGRFLLELAAAQLGLASPLILLLGGVGLARAMRTPAGKAFLPAALILPALVYFLVHALHDRVQGNWPCFLYPMLALLAAEASHSDQAQAHAPAAPWGLLGRRWRALATHAAPPLAAVMLLLVYIQLLTGVLPLGKNDPLACCMGGGFRPIAAAMASAAGQGGVLTSDYETTAWLRYYQPGIKVIQVTDPQRYAWAPAPGRALLQAPLLYLVEAKHDRSRMLRQDFASVDLATELAVSRKGRAIARYRIYAVEGLRHTPDARLP